MYWAKNILPKEHMDKRNHRKSSKNWLKARNQRFSGELGELMLYFLSSEKEAITQPR